MGKALYIALTAGLVAIATAGYFLLRPNGEVPNPSFMATPMATESGIEEKTLSLESQPEYRFLSGPSCYGFSGDSSKALYRLLELDPNIGGHKGSDLVAAYRANPTFGYHWEYLTQDQIFALNSIRAGNSGTNFSEEGRVLWTTVLNDPFMDQDKTIEELCGTYPTPFFRSLTPVP